MCNAYVIYDFPIKVIVYNVYKIIWLDPDTEI